MPLFSDETLYLNQFKYFKRLMNRAIDKNIAFSESQFISEYDPISVYLVKYPFIKDIIDIFLNNIDDTSKLNHSAKVANDYFKKLYKEKRKKAVQDRKHLVNDRESIISIVMSQSNEVIEKSSVETTKSDAISDKNFEKFYTEILKMSLYNKKNKCFNVNDFKDEYEDKKGMTRYTKVTELRSLQYLFVYYNQKYLNQNINRDLMKVQFDLFNTRFQAKHRGSICKMSSENWNHFYDHYYEKRNISKFYIELCEKLDSHYE